MTLNYLFNKMKKYLAVLPVAMLLVLPLLVLAQLPTVSPPIVPGLTLAEAENLVRRVAQFIIVIGVIFAVIWIVLGGIAWMRAAGDETKVKAAKDRVWAGVWGALVVLAVGLILQTLAGVVTRVFFQ